MWTLQRISQNLFRSVVCGAIVPQTSGEKGFEKFLAASTWRYSAMPPPLLFLNVIGMTGLKRRKLRYENICWEIVGSSHVSERSDIIMVQCLHFFLEHWDIFPSLKVKNTLFCHLKYELFLS